MLSYQVYDLNKQQNKKAKEFFICFLKWDEKEMATVIVDSIKVIREKRHFILEGFSKKFTAKKLVKKVSQIILKKEFDGSMLLREPFEFEKEELESNVMEDEYEDVEIVEESNVMEDDEC